MEREAEEWKQWNELLAAALKEPPETIAEITAPEARLDVPATQQAPQQDLPEAARSLGVNTQLWGQGASQGLGNILSGSLPAAVTQGALPGNGSSWLKWINPIAGLVSLFTGREDEQDDAAPVLAPRLAKRSVAFGLSASEGGIFGETDTDERGRVRMAESKAAEPQQIVVQVQAMDSRSFLDHRDEIASAVRQALMESHGLGTVLNEFQE